MDISKVGRKCSQSVYGLLERRGRKAERRSFPYREMYIYNILNLPSEFFVGLGLSRWFLSWSEPFWGNVAIKR